MSSSPASSPHLRYVAWWCLPCFAGTHSLIFDYFLAYLRWKLGCAQQSVSKLVFAKLMLLALHSLLAGHELRALLQGLTGGTCAPRTVEYRKQANHTCGLTRYHNDGAVNQHGSRYQPAPGCHANECVCVRREEDGGSKFAFLRCQALKILNSPTTLGTICIVAPNDSVVELHTGVRISHRLR
ncbi:hypothetical protein EV401DRAFT_2022049, partial [Pisolithus croceorrhizus]